MVRAWYMDESPADHRLEHQRQPPAFLSLEELFRRTGVECLQLNTKNYEDDEILNGLKKKQGYNYEDEITCAKEHLENYEEKVKIFFTEHLHAGDEIRLVIGGSGYFDVRDTKDQWIRIEVKVNDLIILPSGMYHRFSQDMNNYIKLKRYFVEKTVWRPHNRPVDEMSCRKQYLERLENGFQAQLAQICKYN